MSNQKLTKVEALQMITSVVDEEVSPQQRQAFMKFIEKHDDVRRKYESMKKLKSLVHSRCPCQRAPESLKNKVRQLVADEKTSPDELQSELKKICEAASQKDTSAESSTPSLTRNVLYSSVTAVLLVVVIGGAIYYFNGSQQTTSSNVEHLAYKHFKKHAGNFISPSISTSSLTFAEQKISDQYHINMTVPSVDSSNLMGVVHTDFAPHYKAIMLEYYFPHQHQYIYIYAFDLNKLNDFGKLVRSRRAIEICQKPDDFEVEEINGKHVVSWKWGNVWYAAISNHTGKRLASLVKPLHYSASAVSAKD